MPDRYEELYRSYRWEVPERYNIARACCGSWAVERHRFALYWEDESGAMAAYTAARQGDPAASNASARALAASRNLGSTHGDLVLDVCSNCHQAYTGVARPTPSGSRIERFERRRRLADTVGTRK